MNVISNAPFDTDTAVLKKKKKTKKTLLNGFIMWSLIITNDCWQLKVNVNGFWNKCSAQWMMSINAIQLIA